eukprot:scaffold120993_cov72-Phaeocystis_antarctica.AAC.1
MAEAAMEAVLGPSAFHLVRVELTLTATAVAKGGREWAGGGGDGGSGCCCGCCCCGCCCCGGVLSGGCKKAAPSPGPTRASSCPRCCRPAAQREARPGASASVVVALRGMHDPSAARMRSAHQHELALGDPTPRCTCGGGAPVSNS